MNMTLTSVLAGMCLAFHGQKYQISQVTYVTEDFVVCEFQEPIQLDGRTEQYLAITCDAHVFSIDIFGSPSEFLTVDHGLAQLEAA